MNEIEVLTIEMGGTARLRTGGPRMTVLVLGPSEAHELGEGEVDCGWFDGRGDYHVATFPVRGLRAEAEIKA